MFATCKNIHFRYFIMAGIVANKVRKAREKEVYDAKDKTEMVRIAVL